MDSLHNQDLQSEVHECLGSCQTKLVDLYLSGRDHDLQHLEFKGHPTSFVISGRGGAELVGWTTPPQAQG
jgi:tartrate-resistant acid phosphatase type 5